MKWLALAPAGVGLRRKIPPPAFGIRTKLLRCAFYRCTTPCCHHPLFLSLSSVRLCCIILYHRPASRVHTIIWTVVLIVLQVACSSSSFASCWLHWLNALVAAAGGKLAHAFNHQQPWKPIIYDLAFGKRTRSFCECNLMPQDCDIGRSPLILQHFSVRSALSGGTATRGNSQR
jgi:hypothetical protein